MVVLANTSNGRIFVGNGGNATDPMFANVSDTNTGIAFPAADTMMFTTGGSERLRVDSSGRLLVGTTSSSGSHIFEVNSGTDNEGIKVVSTDAGSYIRFADNSTTGSTRLGAVGDDFKIDVASAERLRILSNGRVAIDGATANSQLDVHGGDGISITNSGDTFLQSRTTGTTGTNYLEFKDSGGGSGAISYHHNGDSMRFKVAGSERLRITSDGQLAGLDPGGGAPQNINNANVNLGGRYIWNRISSSNNVTTTTSNQFRIAFYRNASGGHNTCYYRGVNIKIHAGGRTDWGGHGFVTYVGELLMTFSGTTSGRTHVITNEGYSFLQNNSNNMRFVEATWSYDSNYLYATMRFNTNESGTGWKPYYNIEIIDNDGIVQNVTGL